MRNCFGDIYRYNLCPNQPEVCAYVCGLVEDVCVQFAPQRIVLEAVGYLGLRHGEHHELAMTYWDETLDLLTSLCFCPACMAAGERAGLNSRRLAVTVRSVAHGLLDEQEEAPVLDGKRIDAASLLSEMPQLAEYLACRSAAVSALVAGAAETVNSRKVRLETIPASFHRPANRAWIEGADVREIAALSDALFLPTYASDPAEITADIDWTQAESDDAPISAAILVCAPSCTGQENLASQIRAVAESGAQAIYYYNFGMLTTRRLNWLAALHRSK